MKKKIALIFILVIILPVAGVFVINFYVKSQVSGQIVSKEELKIQSADCILILGAGIWGNRPSPMLKDRLIYGIDLYEAGVSDRLLMTGDHGRKEYDEVNLMKAFAISEGVPSEHIFMDHAGFSTYESMYRGKEIFKVEKIVIVTQEYHLYRALYLAKSLGIEAVGVPSDPRNYAGQTARDVRELLAIIKDFFKVIAKPEPTYLGDVIPITGNGDLTND